MPKATESLWKVFKCHHPFAVLILANTMLPLLLPSSHFLASLVPKTKSKKADLIGSAWATSSCLTLGWRRTQGCRGGRGELQCEKASGWCSATVEEGATPAAETHDRNFPKQKEWRPDVGQSIHAHAPLHVEPFLHAIPTLSYRNCCRENIWENVLLGISHRSWCQHSCILKTLGYYGLHLALTPRCPSSILSVLLLLLFFMSFLAPQASFWL